MKKYLLYAAIAAFPATCAQADWLGQLKEAAEKYQTHQEQAKIGQQRPTETTRAAQPGFLERLQQAFHQAYEEAKKEQEAKKAQAPAQEQPSILEQLRQAYEQMTQKQGTAEPQKKASWWDLLTGVSK